MSFTIGGRWIFADAKITGIRGDKALGGHRLFLDLDLALKERPADQHVVLAEIVADVTASGGGGQGFLGRMRPVGEPYLVSTSVNSRVMQCPMFMSLTIQQVDALESLRIGGDLLLKVEFRGRAELRAEVETIDERQEHRVQQGTWASVLEQMGYGRTLLLEVPLPDAENAPNLVEPVRHLEKAHQAMLRGEWQEAVASCRDVLEALRTVLGALKAGVPEGETHGEYKKMSKQSRFREVERTLQHVADLAKHADELAQETEWERRDARAVVAAVAALVSRYGPPGR